mgnify:CR=1 FL=1
MFDVDVEEGALPRKLALNRGDNPYDVADRFLEENNLPQSYRCGGACSSGMMQAGTVTGGLQDCRQQIEG